MIFGASARTNSLTVLESCGVCAARGSKERNAARTDTRICRKCASKCSPLYRFALTRSGSSPASPTDGRSRGTEHRYGVGYRRAPGAASIPKETTRRLYTDLEPVIEQARVNDEQTTGAG